MIKEKEVKALFPGENISSCIVQYSSFAPWRLSIDCGVYDIFKSEAEDLFEAYKDIRALLLEKGIILLCNGSRKNIYPSQMLRQSGGGRMAYMLRFGIPARKEDIINIFDQIEICDVDTIEKQNLFYDKWLTSLDPTPKEIAEAGSHPDGWVYRIDGSFDDNEKIPPSAIIGAWKVSSVGKITNVFKVNKNFIPIQHID